MTLACALATGLFLPAVSARPSATAAHASAPGASRPVLPSAPRLGGPSVGGLSSSEISQLNSQSQLDRLIDPSGQNYAIVPPNPPSQIPKGPVPGYQVVRLGRAHNNRLCLAGTVAGTKGLMMLDTGANNTALGDASYRALLLNATYALPRGLPHRVTLNGTNVALVEAPNFYVGKANLGAVPVCLVPHRYLFDASPLDNKGRLYDGLLGENILRPYNAIVDCARLTLYLDIDPAKKLNLRASFVRHGWTRVPMSDAGNDFTVPCVLNGHSYRLIVDTGAPFTNLDRHLLDKAQIGSRDLPVRGGLIGTQAGQVGLVDLDRLQIGGYLATGVHMTTTSESMAAFGGRNDRSTDGPIVGLLGGDILGRNGAVVDIGNKALYLKAATAKISKRQ